MTETTPHGNEATLRRACVVENDLAGSDSTLHRVIERCGPVATGFKRLDHLAALVR